MSKKHWSEYWNTGVLTSLPSDFKENYDGELFDYWELVLLSEQSHRSVLDVCTGNGAVAILLSSIAEENDLPISITAIDASDINPTHVLKAFPHKTKQIDNIQFIGNCLVENMAESIHGDFDLIVSQYGIEYCDTKTAAKNIFAKLKPNGKFVFVAHSPNTAILEYMKVEQQIFEFLQALDVFKFFKQFSINQLSTNGFKNKLAHMLHQMGQQHQFKTQNLFNIWGQTMYQLSQMKNVDLKEQRFKVGQFAQSHLYAMQRAQDMLDVSNKLINDEHWYKPFEHVGMKLQNHGEITYKGKHNVGHFYEFIKSQD